MKFLRPGAILLGVAALIALALALGVHRIRRDVPAAPSPSASVASSAPVTSAPATDGPDTVSFAGIRDIRFGQTAAELTTRHGLHKVATACMPRFADIDEVHPILVDGKLAILTLEPPAHTPEGVGVGAKMATVRTAYPGVVELSAPQPYAYSGLLATNGDMGYLFLSTGDTVQKELVGYTHYLRQLFDAAFPTC